MKCSVCLKYFDVNGRDMVGLGQPICIGCDIYLCNVLDQNIGFDFSGDTFKVWKNNQPQFDPNDTKEEWPIIAQDDDVDRVVRTITSRRN